MKKYAAGNDVFTINTQSQTSHFMLIHYLDIYPIISSIITIEGPPSIVLKSLIVFITKVF